MDSKSALAELKSFQGSRKGAGDYQSQFQQELGVGDAQARANDIRQQIRQTESALKGVGSSVAGRTRGFGVNEAQRARLVNLESQPIAQQLGERQGAFADEQQNYRDLLAQATSRAGQAYQTDADRLASLESNYSKAIDAERAAAEEARWRAEFDERNRQFEENMRASREQSARNQAAMANLYRTPSYAPTAAAPTPQPAAPTPVPRLAAPGIFSASNISGAAKGGYFSDIGKNIQQGWQNVTKYGPLALFGKGTLF